MSAPAKSIVTFLDDYLRTREIKDLSRNGWQVQGADRVQKIGLAVDACLATYQRAVAARCQMLICHHGIIWGGIDAVRGPVQRQLRFLLQSELNLYASHLPLDLHPVVGNNAQLAKVLGLARLRPFGDYEGITIGYAGSFAKPRSLAEIRATLRRRLNAPITTLPFGPAQVTTLGIVSGGAAGELAQAIDQGLDAYLTGEPAHYNHHQALEGKINVLYAGHYHTETVGVRALGRLLERKFRVKTEFLDVPTIV